MAFGAFKTFTTEERREEMARRIVSRSRTGAASSPRQAAELQISSMWANEEATIDDLLVLANSARIRGTELVELELHIDIRIDAEEDAAITYTHRLLNVGTAPIASVRRKLWFENPKGHYDLETSCNTDHHVLIRDAYRLDQLYEFECVVSPALAPGDEVELAYTARPGPVFVDNHYWRQAIARYTRLFTIQLREESGRTVKDWDTQERLPDGTMRSIHAATRARQSAETFHLRVERHFLRPEQEIAISWEMG